MTPGARIAAAIECLDVIAAETRAADSVLDSYFRKRRYAGSKDRKAIQTRVYDVLRRRARLDWWCERTGLPQTAQTESSHRPQLIADLALNGKETPQGIAAIFSGNRHCPERLSTAEMDLAQALAGRPLTHHSDMPDAVRLEYPEWLNTELRLAFGDDLDPEMTSLNQPAAVDLRANTIKGTWEQANAALEAALVDFDPTPFSPLGFRLSGHARLGGLSAYRDGLVEIQDEGSQLVALLTDAQPGMCVIDFCAGAGGKTLALAAQMAQGKTVDGSLIACDIYEGRMDRMQDRLKRAGVRGVERHVLNVGSDPWITDHASTADRVLVDVPCSGSGTWRRHPEAKWRLTPQDLTDLRDTQADVLDRAATLVRPKGRLVYVTCSILPGENETQIDGFLHRRDDFSVVGVSKVWPTVIGGPVPDHAEPFLHLSPWKTGTDGFFCAILERQVP